MVWASRIGSASLLSGIAALVVVSARRLIASTLRQRVNVSALSSQDHVQFHSGNQLVMIFVGASTCGASNYPHLPSALRKMKQQLRTAASLRSEDFYTVGVAVDWSVSDGLHFLSESGPYDEISVGDNWMNLDAISYIVRNLPGAADIPQVILLERSLDLEGPTPTISDDRLVTRKVGVTAIEQLAKDDFHAMLGNDSAETRNIRSTSAASVRTTR
jgi:hypothetical protein